MGSYADDLHEYMESSIEEYPGEIGLRAGELAAWDAALRDLGFAGLDLRAFTEPGRQVPVSMDQERIRVMVRAVLKAFLRAAGTHPSSAHVRFGEVSDSLT